MKTLYVGYDAPLEKGALIEAMSVNKFCCGSLVESRMVIDLDGKRINSAKLKDILRKATNDIVCRISDVGRIKSLTKYFDKILYYNRDANFDIFHTLMLILSDDNRVRVYRHLEKWKPPLRVLMKWLISNVMIEDEENIGWLQQIDMRMEKVAPKIIWAMLSLIEPEYSAHQRYYYKFKKVGG